jgi:hypothetical protein
MDRFDQIVAGNPIRERCLFQGSDGAIAVTENSRVGGDRRSGVRIGGGSVSQGATRLFNLFTLTIHGELIRDVKSGLHRLDAVQ